MIRPMNLVGKKSPVLREVALPVVLSDETLPRLLQLAQRMFATVQVRHGLALAAPQVGVGQRLIVVGDGSVWVNPVLELDDLEVIEEPEACLSLPGRVYSVSRALRCSLTVTGLDGSEATFDLEGLEARLAQHEVDHLDGILALDRGRELANGGMSALKL